MKLASRPGACAHAASTKPPSDITARPTLPSLTTKRTLRPPARTANNSAFTVSAANYYNMTLEALAEEFKHREPGKRDVIHADLGTQRGRNLRVGQALGRCETYFAR